MWENFFEIASRITHPVTVALFALILAAYLFSTTIKKKHKRVEWFLVAIILILGLAPLAASTFLQSQGVYHVRVIVLGPDQTPLDDAHVTSPVAGEPKRVEIGWEFDIPPQTKPADGKVVLFGSKKDSFLTGSSTLVLGQDYYPTSTIQLAADTSAMLRGRVVDERGRSVAGAQVSISGYPDLATTNQMGNFVLPAHAADGQMVSVHAEKNQLIGSLSVQAGKLTVDIIIKRP
jgi:hypothetical protein